MQGLRGGVTVSIACGIISGMEQTEKVRENRLRRMARRQGKRLSRNPTRDPYALKFGMYSLDGIEVGDLAAVERHLRGEA